MNLFIKYIILGDIYNFHKSQTIKHSTESEAQPRVVIEPKAETLKKEDWAYFFFF